MVCRPLLSIIIVEYNTPSNFDYKIFADFVSSPWTKKDLQERSFVKFIRQDNSMEYIFHLRTLERFITGEEFRFSLHILIFLPDLILA